MIFSHNRLSTLDCSIFVENGKMLHSFFEKPMRSDRCLDASTALSETVIRSSLRQEIVRRLTNTHLDIPLSEKVDILDSFYVKLRNSGHSHGAIRLSFIEALAKSNNMVNPLNVGHNTRQLLKSNWRVTLRGLQI